MSQSINKKCYSSIDLFKFIAAILVVAIHTHPFFSCSVDVDYYFTCFCRIAVPFFFIATSFFFFRREQPDIKRYTKRLSLLYLIWFLIELPIVYNRFFVTVDKTLSLQILNFFRCLVFNNTWFASWFIMACILSVNIIYYLSRIMSNRQLLLLSCACYALSLICSSYSGAFDLLLNEKWRHYHALVSFIFMPANSFILAMIYIVLGKIVAERERIDISSGLSKPLNMVLFFIALVIWGLEVHFIKWSVSINDAFLFLPLVTLLGFTLLLKMELRINQKRSFFMRSMSILVYILHPIFTLINTSFLELNYGISLFLVTLLESIFVAFFIVLLSSRVPRLKWLY